jgi:hypothetical protein
MNHSNKDKRALAESEEGRPSIKENAGQPHTYPTQSGKGLSQGLTGVREAALPACNESAVNRGSRVTLCPSASRRLISRLPARVVPLFRLPAVWLLPGQTPAQLTRSAADGNASTVGPTSATRIQARRCLMPGTVSHEVVRAEVLVPRRNREVTPPSGEFDRENL